MHCVSEWGAAMWIYSRLMCVFFFSEQSRAGSSVLHNSVGGGTVQSARDHLIKFLLLQPHLHVHAVMFTQAEEKHMTHTTTVMNGLAVIHLQPVVYISPNHRLCCVSD